MHTFVNKYVLGAQPQSEGLQSQHTPEAHF